MKYRLRKLKVIIAVILLMTMSLINLQGDLVFANGNDSQFDSNKSQTGADCLGNVTFYDYYGRYDLKDYPNDLFGQHYSFERFNETISDYARKNEMEYPLYFGDFNNEEGVANGQPLLGQAYRFYWPVNRANRTDYSASVQGIVSENLDSEGYITQNKIGEFIVTDENSKKYEYTEQNVQMINGGNRWITSDNINGRTGSLKLYFAGEQSGEICERVRISANERNYSATSKYLTFEVLNKSNGATGSPYVSIEDENGNKIGGWAESLATSYSDNMMPTNNSEWKRIIIDLKTLKNNSNSNFDFSKIKNIYFGYWAHGDIYINDIRFVGKMESSVVRLPYFNESFVSGDVGETISDLKFPFKKRLKTENGLDTYYYTFSSGKSGYKFNESNITDVVRINRATNNLDYWFDVPDNNTDIIVRDMNGTKGWGTGTNEPGFFPFNSAGDSSRVDRLNYGFGAKIEIQFKLTADGKIKNIHGQDVPIEFNFKGDDDVWVYVDGQLALDMGGAHSQTTGKIDFASRKSTVDSVVIGDLKSNSLYQPVKSVTTDLKLADNSYTDDGKYDTNKVHTLTLFYMERGMIESNLYMDFNFIPSENELIVEKEVDTTGVNNILASKTQEIANNINFGFNISENGTPKQNLDYKLKAGEQLTDKTMNGDTFELKNTNTATFYNKFSKGSNVVVSEKADNRFTTKWITKKLSENEEVVLGEGTGIEANAFNIPQDTSLYEKYIYYAKFINSINTGELNISKKLVGILDKNKEFTFRLKFTKILDQEISPINYNGVYYVDGQERNSKLEEDVIKLKAGETATIPGIPVGTTYEIEEILDDGYVIENIIVDNSNCINNNIVTSSITAEPSKNKVTYVNKKIVKTVELIKVDANDSNIKLQGAKFILNKLNENGEIDGGFDSKEVISDKNGHVSFGDLPYGKYIITEIEAPEGYKLLRDPIEFTIGDETKDDVITIQVENIKDIKLPATGGNGNITSNYIGFMLIGLAVILYSFVIIRNKKYKFN